MIKKILIAVTALFFISMLFLSVFAEKIHDANLPKVTVSRPETHMFEETFTDENGESHTVYTEKPVVSAQQLENGVYVIYSAEKNGTKRSFVRLAQIKTGMESDGCFEIVSGISGSEKIVTESTGRLYDGCEVIEVR